MEIVRPLFPPAIDSTFLAAFRSCPQKAFRSYVEHWKPQRESIHLHAGGCFASAVEAVRRAFWVDHIDDQDECIAIGMVKLVEEWGEYEEDPEEKKSLGRMLGALVFYCDSYRLGEDGAEPILLADQRRGIEFSFAEPLDILHPVSGDPILFTGRADAIQHFNGGVFLFDEKTTSSLGQYWSKQWELRSQFTGYAWACRQSGIPVDGVVVRGISILKERYDTAQAITFRPDWEIDRWYDQAHRDIARAIECWKSGYWDYNLDHSCAEYGGCSMQLVCKSPNPENWLPMYFEKRVWDPVARQEITVEDWEQKWNHIPLVSVG